MSALALPIPALDGGTANSQEHLASDRQRLTRTDASTRLVTLGRALAASLMLLAMGGSALVGALPVHSDGHAHEAPVESDGHADAQEANVATGLLSLWALAVRGWQALKGVDICNDCNLPVDDGCRCVCYSGGYDPNDPACQF